MDEQVLGAILNGPYGFLVAFSIFAWLAAKEFRKARTEDVAEARAEAEAEKVKRVAAEAERDAVQRDRAEDRRTWEQRLSSTYAENTEKQEEYLRRITLARNMLIERGVAAGDLP